MSDDIKLKIKKLLALAADKAATEGEASNAMRMAMGLMVKHGIEQSELSTVEERKAKKGKPVVARFDGWEIELAAAAAHLYACKLVILNKGKAGLYFVGRQDNIDAAEATLMFLAKQLEAFYKQALPSGMTQKARSEFRKTFKYACAVRVQMRAIELVEEMQKNDALAKGATGKGALVVQGYFKQMLAEADEAMEPMKTMKPKKFKFGSGTEGGLAAGDRVKLRQEVQ